MNTASKPMYEWKTIPWEKVEKVVFKLQKRIYQVSERDDRKTVHKMQRLLMKSWYARLLATRRVTQDNQGKKTPGIDGIVVLTCQGDGVIDIHVYQYPPSLYILCGDRSKISGCSVHGQGVGTLHHHQNRVPPFETGDQIG